MARPLTDVEATRQQLLEAAEQLLARHGSRKVTVSDVAAGCGMSQSNAYRFFPSKAALMTGIAERWFAEIETKLTDVAEDAGPAENTLQTLLMTQLRIKRARFDANPTLFLSHLELAARNMDAVWAHVHTLSALYERVVTRWLAEVALDTSQARNITRLIEDATILFRDPNLIARRRDECTDERARAVIRNAMAGVIATEKDKKNVSPKRRR
jgi:AcrR family transcriptional regulator